MDHTLFASTPCTPCWNSFSWLFRIAGQQTTRTSNYKNSYGLFALQSFTSVTWSLLFDSTDHSQFSSLLTHWFILNHIKLVFIFVYYFFAFESISQTLCAKKPKIWIWQGCMFALPVAFSSHSPGKHVDLNVLKTLHVNYVTRKNPILLLPFIFFKPHPISFGTLPFFLSAHNESSHWRSDVTLLTITLQFS